VFAGSWTVAAAEDVCTGDFLGTDHVVDCLDKLVRNCLVQIVDRNSDARRFAMLETLREYAAEQLEGAGEADTVRARHQEWCLALARQAQSELTGPHQQLWLDVLQTNIDNMRTALSWALASGSSGGAPGRELGALQLATALWRFWWVRGYLDEGRRVMADVLAQNATAAPADRAAALFGAGMLAWGQADVPAARQLYERSLELRRLASERSDLAETLNALAITLHTQGDDARARAAYEESLLLYRELEDGWGSANALAGLAVMARDDARWQHALALYDESLQLRRTRGDKHAIAKSLHDIGLLYVRLGDLASARAALTESLKLYHDIGRDSGIADCLGALSWVAVKRGRPSLAARALSAAQALRASMRVPLPPADFAEHQQWEAEVRALVDQGELSETLAAALTRSREEIVREVVADIESLDG
jgi:non-specific serine/threonine protein kinase